MAAYLVQHFAEVDAILESFRPIAFQGPKPERQFAVYRSHAQRTANIALINLTAMRDNTPVQPKTERLVAVTAAFHDMGVWLDTKSDYRDRSCQAVREYMAQQGTDEFSEEDQEVACHIIREHHKLLPIECTGPNAEELQLVEAFRRADSYDGLPFLSPAVTKQQLQQLNGLFSEQGIFNLALEVTFDTWRSNGMHTNPMPFVKW